jgi:hypothetical protein
MTRTHPLRNRLRTLLGALLRAAALCASAAGAATSPRAGQAPAAPMPSAAQLAVLVFQGWSETHAGRLQTVALPASGGAAYAGWGAGARRVIVDPKLVLPLDADHLTLVATMVPAGDDGKAAATHMTPAALAAYQFARAGASWKVTGRQGIFAWRGFFGEATLRAVELAAHRQAIGVEYGSCWDGYCGTWMALYELDSHAVRREPAVELALSGNDVDGAPDCARRLHPLLKPHPQEGGAHDDGSPPAAHDCYMMESSWNIEPSHDQPGDLVIHYQGAISRGDSYAGPPVAIDQRQVLHYSSGKYRAVSGFDPVPPI